MSLVKTDAIVLSSIKQGETSKIIRLITQEFGRVSIIAKGSRQWKNRFGPAFDALNHISIVYYQKENRDLQMVSQCDITDAFPGLRLDLNKLALGLSSAEIIQDQFVEEEPNESMFQILLWVLTSLEKAENNFLNYYWVFLSRFLKISGFALTFDSCAMCGKEVQKENVYFSKSKGSVVCSECRYDEAVRPISPETFSVLKRFLSDDLKSVDKIAVSTPSENEIRALFDSFFRYHFEGYKSPQSLKLYI